MIKFLVSLVCVMLLVTACGPAAIVTPTATLAPLVATHAPAATLTPLAATRVPPTNTPLPAAGGSTGDLSITIIYDNTAHDARLQTDWGFAALVEYGDHTLLFDTGANGQMLVSNTDKLGIDPKWIEAIVLSHAHDDHVNGLHALLDRGITPQVYVLSSFGSSFKNGVRARTNLVEVSGPLEILPGLHSTGALGTSIVEQVLVVKTGQGIVVITGCAHPGIVSIVRQVKKMMGGDVTLVVGGLHLQGNGPSQRVGTRAEPINLTTEDNVTLSATLFGQGKLAVILAHQGTQGTDQTSWQPFARLLAEKGYAALTFDFRGRGQSQGYLQTNQLIKDVNAAIQFLRGRGYQRIVCMGASMGGTACLRAALDHDLAGLVVIASPMSSGTPTATEPDEFSRLKLPKLYVCAENDRYSLVIPQMKQMFDLSHEPKQIKFFPGTVHGTELFDTEYGDEFRHLLLSFVEQLR